MSYPTVIYWPAAGGEIAPLQDVPEDDTLTLFSNVSNAPGIFQYNNIIRSIVIESIAADNDAQFVVSGIGAAVDENGNPTTVLRPITETINIVGEEEVESTHIFSQITSITVRNNGVSDVQVKYGTFGITRYVFTDYNRRMAQIGVSGQVVEHDSLSYTVYMSYNKPEAPAAFGYDEVHLGLDTFKVSSSLKPFGVEILDRTSNDAGIPTQIAFIPAFELIAESTETKSAVNDGPAAVVWATITGTTTDSLYFTVLQQGIN